MTNPSNTEICDHCHSDKLVDNCIRCGAPVCCSVCCKTQALEDKLKATRESLRDHMMVLSTLRDKHGVSADLIGDIFDEEES